jgi:hypothetical protein
MTAIFITANVIEMWNNTSKQVSHKHKSEAGELNDIRVAESIGIL